MGDALHAELPRRHLAEVDARVLPAVRAAERMLSDDPAAQRRGRCDRAPRDLNASSSTGRIRLINATSSANASTNASSSGRPRFPASSQQQIAKYRQQATERHSETPQPTPAHTYAEALAAARSTWTTFNTDPRKD
jgi:hypothetical protein